jgi:hypothetical protein
MACCLNNCGDPRKGRWCHCGHALAHADPKYPLQHRARAPFACAAPGCWCLGFRSRPTPLHCPEPQAVRLSREDLRYCQEVAAARMQEQRAQNWTVDRKREQENQELGAMVEYAAGVALLLDPTETCRWEPERSGDGGRFFRLRDGRLAEAKGTRTGRLLLPQYTCGQPPVDWTPPRCDVVILGAPHSAALDTVMLLGYATPAICTRHREVQQYGATREAVWTVQSWWLRPVHELTGIAQQEDAHGHAATGA